MQFRFLINLSFLFLAYVSLEGQVDTYQTANNIPDLMIQYVADEGSLNRFYIIDGSPERQDRMRRFYQSYLDQLVTFDYVTLSVSEQADYHMMMRKLKDKLHLLQIEKEEVQTISSYISYGSPIYEYEKKRRRGLKLDHAQLAGVLEQITRSIDSMSNAIAKSNVKLEQRFIKRGVQVLIGQKKALQSIWEFYKGYDPLFTWWVEKPKMRLDTAIDTYIKAYDSLIDLDKMNQDDGSGIVGTRTGRSELLRLLKRDMIPYSPEELIDIAQKEFAWCDKELLKASNEMGFGDKWKAAQEKVKQSYVPPGEQPEAMLALYNQSIAFLKEHDLITIPPLAEETWRMTMLTPKQQLTSPFFLGGETLMIAYPTESMEHEAKMMSMRGNNPHFSRATVHHELIAGHHLQGYMNRRYNTHRRGQFRTPFWMEGWALYWELLLYEKEFPRSPEDRIGMLFWRMHRCARIMFSLNYHLEKWTPQECIDFLVDRVGHERDNAEAEVRRSFTTSYPPLYQLAYMTGGLQIYALKKELVDSGKMTYREFHDAIMHENAMPIEMLRYILKNEPIPNDFETSWRFYRQKDE